MKNQNTLLAGYPRKSGFGTIKLLREWARRQPPSRPPTSARERDRHHEATGQSGLGRSAVCFSINTLGRCVWSRSSNLIPTNNSTRAFTSPAFLRLSFRPVEHAHRCEPPMGLRPCQSPSYARIRISEYTPSVGTSQNRKNERRTLRWQPPSPQIVLSPAVTAPGSRGTGQEKAGTARSAKLVLNFLTGTPGAESRPDTLIPQT